MFSNKATSATLEALRSGGWLSSFGIDSIAMEEDDKKLLKFLIKEKYISRDILMSAVHVGLCTAGRRAYEWCMKNPALNHPDHSTSPKALGYAMMHRVFSQEEISKLQFDHGETVEEYIRSAEGLLDLFVAEFVKPYVKPKASKFPKGSGYRPCCA